MVAAETHLANPNTHIYIHHHKLIYKINEMRSSFYFLTSMQSDFFLKPEESFMLAIRRNVGLGFRTGGYIYLFIQSMVRTIQYCGGNLNNDATRDR